ncbi:MAG: Coenzyme F420 hydrogenase/dehydrogenase, beta subunit C-terminal domain [Chloroflexota bacterium]
MSLDFGFEDLRNQVVNRGLCTVCGTCIGVCPQRCLALEYEDEDPSPVLRGECTSCGLCLKACPGADVPIPELDRFCFGKTRENRPDDLGIYTYSGMGYANDTAVRRAGASGGVTTALLVYGLEKGLIDCALVAGFSADRPWRAEARLAATREELLEAAQSKYTPVPINSLLSEAVRRGYKSIALVGCPCHIHAIRKIEYRRLAPNITRKVSLLIGLLCGSQFYFEGTRHLLAELCGVDDLQHLARLQYRGRRDAGDWSSYFVAGLKSGEQRRVSRLESLRNRLTLFTRERCSMCIDWSAELADISVGDYWGPHIADAEGHCSVLVRTARGDDWTRKAAEAGAITLKECAAGYLLNCLGFERKKHGGAFHLLQRQRYGWPTPNFHYQPTHAPFDSKTVPPQ